MTHGGATSVTRSRGSADERGSIAAMLVIFAVCLLLAISAVTNIAASYLRRQVATSLADGAALSASDAAAAAGVYGSLDDNYVVVDQTAAAAAVYAYLQQTGAQGSYPGLRADVVVEGNTVMVSLAMPYELPVALPGVQSTTTIHASGSAVVPIY